ncbi:tripartite tricarboxylate transporter TctB family protein [bacterium]|nr:tripartite tricarboxylate transporter TctB family protein [bacterium]
MKEKRNLREGETVFCLLLSALSVFALYQAFGISGFSSVSSPGVFPMLSTGVMVVSLALVIFGNRKLKVQGVTGFADELRTAARMVLPRVILIYIGIILIYMVTIEPLHFIASSFLFMFTSITVLKGGGLVRSLLVSAVMLACIYLIFHFFFRIVLP